MPIFAIIIVISLALYIFYKAKFFRTRMPMEKRWISAKSGMALGTFVLFFGINQFFLQPGTTSIIVGIIFILLGGASIWAGFQNYRRFLPLAIEEAEKAKGSAF